MDSESLAGPPEEDDLQAAQDPFCHFFGGPVMSEIVAHAIHQIFNP